MTKNNYLKIIIDSFNQIKEEETDLTIEKVKRKYQKEILRAEAEFEIRHQTSKVTFIGNRDIAVNYLKNHVLNGMKSEMYKKTIGKDLLSILDKAIKKSPTIEDCNVLLVNIPSQDDTYKIAQLCYNDIDFIESAFKNIDSDEHPQSSASKLERISLDQSVVLRNIDSDEHPKSSTLKLENFSLDQNINDKRSEKVFSNQFDSVDEKTVYDYFKKELVDKKYLDDEILLEYLIQAFFLKKDLVEKFHFKKSTTISNIRRIFYNYYKTIAQKPYGKQDSYVKLLTDYFHGYDFKTIKSNFSK